MFDPNQQPPVPIEEPPVDPSSGYQEGSGPSVILEALQSGLKRLTPGEHQELDMYIDSRLAELMTKMLGPECGQFLEQFVQDDIDDGGDEDGGPESDMTQGIEAVPYSSTPIREVQARGYG